MTHPRHTLKPVEIALLMLALNDEYPLWLFKPAVNPADEIMLGVKDYALSIRSGCPADGETDVAIFYTATDEAYESLLEQLTAHIRRPNRIYKNGTAMWDYSLPIKP